MVGAGHQQCNVSTDLAGLRPDDAQDVLDAVVAADHVLVDILLECLKKSCMVI